ncbi:response regulator transcription factor [Mangrovimonas sp. CR14]|uniref:response regulator transcription factor n=1 Tax=Mangrovimonas sp. CR14 TaxID=2706120 RepID=UPI001421D72A|nr:response regulator transcription factor [Mangrovimonas sp. CR14]
MFSKVLTVDDLGSINQGLNTILETLGVKEIHQSHYCDEALLKIKKSNMDGNPFQLVITDLSFKPDHHNQKIVSGEGLAEAIKEEFPDTKVIVYSIEDRIHPIKRLIQQLQVEGYVCKGRRGLQELSEAIKRVYEDQIFLSSEVSGVLHSNNDLEIDDFDIELLRQLSFGLSQNDISDYLKKKNMTPSSLSSIEKRISKLRVQFKANNVIHLVAISKDLGLI